MTRLLYRLDDKVTYDYNEYLAEKDKCEVAYKFFVEGLKLNDDFCPTTYEEVVGREKIPFFHS